jgi:DNA polymerase III delta prime subunit
MTLSPPIIGHRAQIDMLLGDLETGNVAHAYLFEGRANLGKFSLAKWFASELLQKGRPAAEAERVAYEARRLIHSDLLVLDRLWMEGVSDDPDELAKYSNVPQHHRAKAKAKTDVIGIDDVRAIQERLQEAGTGRYRCCLIRSVERMQAEAVNALLKILEEPPEGVVFLLTTQSGASLLPTLVSRSRVLHFSRLRDPEMAPLLKDVPEQDRLFLLRVAQGAPGVIVRLKNDEEALRAEREIYASAAAFWRSRSLQQRLQMLVPLHERGAEAESLLFHLALALREDGQSDPASSKALHTLVRGLETNVSRQMLAQRFALAMAS